MRKGLIGIKVRPIIKLPDIITPSNASTTVSYQEDNTTLHHITLNEKGLVNILNDPKER